MTAAPAARPDAARRGRAGVLRTEVLLFLLVVAVLGPLVHPYRAQQASRYAFTAAIVERGTVVLDAYEGVLGVDRAFRDGRYYSDKAPGQPVLMVPFYAAYRAVGGEPATTLRIDEHLGLWWLTLWSSSIPAGILAILLYRYVRRRDPEMALTGAVAWTFGSLLAPFGALLFGHELAACLGFAAFYLASDAGVRPRGLVAAGTLAGLAFAVEYTAAIVVIVVGVLVLWRHRLGAGWYVAGGVPVAVVLGVYHTVVFGGPMRLSYQWGAFSGELDAARGTFDQFTSFEAERVLELFFAGRGLVVATPLFAVGVVGLVLAWRRTAVRHETLAAAAVVAGFLAIPLFWGNPWGGDSPGARYVVPALPFLVAGVTDGWRRFPILGRAGAAIGVATMTLATFTDPIVGRDSLGGVGLWIDMALDGGWVPTVFTIAVGPAGWLVHAGLVVGAAAALHRVASRDSELTKPDGTDPVAGPFLEDERRP